MKKGDLVRFNVDHNRRYGMEERIGVILETKVAGISRGNANLADVFMCGRIFYGVDEKILTSVVSYG